MNSLPRLAVLAACMLAVLLTLTGSALAAAPANDNFADAQVLTSGVTVNGAATEATRELSEPQPNGSWVETVWYRFNVPAQGVVSFKICNDNGSTLWGALYKGTALTNLAAATESSWNPFDCDYTYRVYSAAPGPIYLQAYFADGFTVRADFHAAPANDNFANAQTISGNSASVAYDNSYASHEPGELSDPAFNRHSVWFKWTAPANGTVNATACVPTVGDATNWPKLTLYTGAAIGSLTEQAVGDNNCELAGHDGGRIDSVSVTAGTEYRFKLNTYYPTEGFGPGTFKLNFYPPATNQTVATATDLGSVSSLSTLGSNFGVAETSEVGEPPIYAGEVRPKSVWYKWTAPKTGEFRFDQCEDASSTGDLVIAAFTSNAGANPAPSNLVPVPTIEPSAGDDNCGDFGVENAAGWFTISVTAGTTYWIGVANFATSFPGRAFSLRISDKTIAPTTEPAITGTPLVGQELSVSEGEWTSGGEPIDITFQWRACETIDTCIDLAGQTGPTLALTLDEYWLTVHVVVTVTTTEVPIRQVQFTTEETTRVDLDDDADGVGNEIDSCEGLANGAPKTNGCPITPVAITTNPSISGLPAIGATLTFSPGAAENANSDDPSTADPTSSIDWKSCSSPTDYATCTSLSSAAATYSPTAADGGRYIRVRERWTNGEQTQTLVTNAIGPIPGPPVNPTAPDPITLPKVGKSLGTIKAGNGKVTLKKLRIRCSVACKVNTTVTGRFGNKKLNVRAKLAIAAGKGGTVVIKLNKRQLKLIRAAKKLKATLKLSVTAPGAAPKKLQVALTFK